MFPNLYFFDQFHNFCDGVALAAFFHGSDVISAVLIQIKYGVQQQMVCDFFLLQHFGKSLALEGIGI